MGRESHHALLIKEYFQGLAAEHQHVEAQVELEAIDKVGVLHVLLHYIRLVPWDLTQVVRKEDTLTLTHAVWLHDEGEARLFAYAAG